MRLIIMFPCFSLTTPLNVDSHHWLPAPCVQCPGLRWPLLTGAEGASVNFLIPDSHGGWWRRKLGHRSWEQPPTLWRSDVSCSPQVQEYGGDMPINGEAANEEIVLSDWDCTEVGIDFSCLTVSVSWQVTQVCLPKYVLSLYLFTFTANR